MGARAPWVVRPEQELLSWHERLGGARLWWLVVQLLTEMDPRVWLHCCEGFWGS